MNNSDNRVFSKLVFVIFRRWNSSTLILILWVASLGLYIYLGDDILYTIEYTKYETNISVPALIPIESSKTCKNTFERLDPQITT